MTQRSARTRRAERAVAATILAAVLAACSSADEAPVPAPLASASVTAPATPAAPVMPAAARGTSDKAAIAFVKHYIDVLNYAMATLDSRPIRELSTDDCAPCSAIARRVDNVAAADGRIEGGHWTMASPRVLPAWRSGLAQVQVIVTYPDQTVHERADARPRRFEAGRTLYTFDAVQRGDSYELAGIR